MRTPGPAVVAGGTDRSRLAHVWPADNGHDRSGRWSVLPEQPVPIRYGIYVALAEAGLVLANTPWLERVWQNGRRRTFQWATLAATALLLIQQVVAGQEAVVVTGEYKASYREFAAGEPTTTGPPVFLEGRPFQSEKVLAIIRSLGIYQN